MSNSEGSRRRLPQPATVLVLPLEVPSAGTFVINAKTNLFSLEAVATASPADPIELHCAIEDSSGSASESKLTAIPAG